MLTLLIIFGVALALLDLAAWRYGADTRDGDNWFTHDGTFEVGRR